VITKNILDLIGNTPMVQIKHLNPNPNLKMYIKLEKYNPGGSVKDRIAKYMIEQAEKTGQLTKDKMVIEPTSGTLMGVSKRLREHNPNIHITAVQPRPKTSIQGLKNLQTQYVPAIWKKEFVDEIHSVHPRDAEETARLLTLQEGIFVGPSSGAIFQIALKKASKMERGVMVVMAPDGGEKYLSTTLCDPILCVKCAQKYGIRCSYLDGTPILKAPSPPRETISP